MTRRYLKNFNSPFTGRKYRKTTFYIAPVDLFYSTEKQVLTIFNFGSDALTSFFTIFVPDS